MKKYDSWYENIEGKTSEEFVEFVNDQFPLFDAICVLNGFRRFEYRVAVNTAVKMNKDLFIVPEMVDVGKTNAKIVCLDDILTLYMPKTEFSAAELFFKRTVDIVLSLAGLIVAAIPMAVIAAAIKLTSPGPVIYKQTRYTRGKREFEIYKFRTMIPDAEKLSGPKFAEKKRSADNQSRKNSAFYAARRTASDHKYTQRRYERSRTETRAAGFCRAVRERN